MNSLDMTTREDRRQHMPRAGGTDMVLTVFDGGGDPISYRLGDFHRDVVRFGRGNDNDIVLRSNVVTHDHGRFRREKGQWLVEDRAACTGEPSRNGLIYNDRYVYSHALSDGDVIRIDDSVEALAEGVLMLVVDQSAASRWETLPVAGQKTIRIGRSLNCDIVLPHITVSKNHAEITLEQGRYYIRDLDSTNGVLVNGQPLAGKQRLHEKDIISITNSKLVFTSSRIAYCSYRSGISVDADDVVITRGRGRKAFVTGDHISLNIRPGELVAIIGGSGAGKSTILNCLCGYLPPASGEVYINGINLYKNFDALKKLIGYVPQSDIVYDNLTLYDMLSYTAKLRLPSDTSEDDRKAAIDRAIQLVELPEKKNSFIKALSGGQKKRASIAVELLSDPNLLFLDEPASGLDPGTERNLMTSLRSMADNGKTVILVTHSTLQLKLCDKIVFMGKGGKLCFFGSYDEALEFFGVSDIVDVYNMITDNAESWRKKYRGLAAPAAKSRGDERRPSAKSRGKKALQLPILCSRYFRLILNDRQRLLLLLFQAPLLALLISLVADGEQFNQYEMTKSLLFTLSCSSFWVGTLNAIQEVCKERVILKREYMTGLRLNAYLLSKILVLGALCLLQSVLIIGVFALTVGLPEEGLLTAPFLELLITSFLTAVASAAMGLFVSSLFTNADRAMTVAPLLLMPQILFSGLIFKLSGITEMISWFAVCRWSMESYGTTANLNELTLRLQQQGIMLPHEAEDFFTYTAAHMWQSWGILLLFVVIFLLLAWLVLSGIGREKS